MARTGHNGYKTQIIILLFLLTGWEGGVADDCCRTLAHGPRMCQHNVGPKCLIKSSVSLSSCVMHHAKVLILPCDFFLICQPLFTLSAVNQSGDRHYSLNGH